MYLVGDIIDFNGDGVSTGYEIVVSDIITISILVGALIVIIRAFLKLRSTSNRVDSFLEDWYGETPRDGIEPRPGVLARLHSLEDDRAANSLMLNDISVTVNQIQAQVEHELNRNGGTSTKDAAHEALRVANEIKANQEHAIEEQALFRREFLEHQRVTQEEWEAVFSTVKEMIGKPIDVQMDLWTRVADAHIVSEDDRA